ncbi:chromosomal replication initiator protein DnaA [Sulfurihydrogenibium azorense]|jgi:chromosomal replication initiator protein|uniref:Chromosomal replication initiator protein DnaA n=1 Tax=Sulfurihydrogenibium azorense (strain DSM 15241 / OCM 825 / Az-Fu1) TaxID=204536 RepID=C1DUG4_SULAA|nr:chromosomal replication initiator protein DnaA [Sulfurihydrogenibium azorense]ACN99545.1 chromosomal replication initiator protein DnaA [Sulfurihydrogenibium azorense Az-Fu1]MDM7272874.1 chromosomal replication initiator protein DnaA [Sulfurihydrogenibium azorense]
MESKEIFKNKIWMNVLADLKEKVDENTYSLLSGLDYVELKENSLYIYTPDNVYKTWILADLLEDITLSAKKVIGQDVNIQVISLKEIKKEEQKREDENFYGYLTLNPKFTFKNLVIGNHNKVAYQSCIAVAENPGKIFNPLFIYGDVGLGKTHMLHATAYHLLKRNQNAKIIYTTADTFASEMFSYIQKGMILEFRKRYKDVDLLLMDDIQFLVGKERTQIEFYHIFNILYTAGKQIILSSDQPPNSLKGIEKRLISRFNSGLIVEITKPDLETKVNIINKKASEYGIEIPREVAIFLGKIVNSSVRELEGAVKRLKAYCDIMGKPLNLEVAKTVLKDVVELQEIKSISVDSIIDEVCSYFKIDKKDLLSDKKNKNLVMARQIAMYLSKTLTEEPLSSLSTYFKKKNHSTIISACNKVEETMNKDRKFKLIVDFLKDKLIAS